jgi:hypothetical protein
MKMHLLIEELEVILGREREQEVVLAEKWRCVGDMEGRVTFWNDAMPSPVSLWQSCFAFFELCRWSRTVVRFEIDVSKLEFPFRIVKYEEAQSALHQVKLSQEEKDESSRALQFPITALLPPR